MTAAADSPVDPQTSETPSTEHEGDSTAPATDHGVSSPEGAASAADPAAESGSWGRVDDDGTVSVREGDAWRVVGQFPDGSPAEALAYFERKYADLAGEVTLLEVRHRRGGASASDLRAAAAGVMIKVDGAAAVGDLAALTSRLQALVTELSAASATEAAAAKQAVDDAVAERTAIVEEAEALAARDPQTVQWKQASAEMSALFERWQKHQQDGPRLPKSTGQQLWKRFRDARSTVDKHRREFYAQLDEAHDEAVAAKLRASDVAPHLPDLGGRKRLEAMDMDVHALCAFEGL